jgi:2-amino-4-hydroxy-6-hydroxymethyldihydropteridine diphosphokinase
VSRLEACGGVRVVGHSSVYETEPVGEVADQRDFYNAVVKIETALGPRELLAVCKQIEAELGRAPAGVRHGPRPIDVDLLLIGDLTVAQEDLAVPHPELAARRFVLAPLAELDPDLTLPDGGTVRQALAAIGPGQRVEPVGAWS